MIRKRHCEIPGSICKIEPAGRTILLYSIFFTYISFIISGSRARVVSPSWMTKAGLFWCTPHVEHVQLLDDGLQIVLRPVAADAPGYGQAVRAGRRMAQEGAYRVRDLRRERVLEGAGVLLEVLVGQREDLCQQPLREPVASYGPFGEPLPVVRERDGVAAYVHQPLLHHPREGIAIGLLGDLVDAEELLYRVATHLPLAPDELEYLVYRLVLFHI